jgi:aspartyl-tRNA(Asn)/glutamyl-tRNA(Gln) amidotransferase subunit A
MTTISELRRRFQSGETTPAAAIEALAAAIAARDGTTGAYLSHDVEAAMAEAARADLTKPLGGIPIGIKDNINVLGQPCTCGSKFLSENYRSPYDATVIRKLREAGAIPFGRLNMDEFAMGSATENSAFRPVRNPHAPDRIPGGSSGGSAASIADGTAIATLGSDTGGSIRQPASHCGVVGLKPSYGRVSRYGLVAFASSLDQIGPLTASVEDAARVLQAIAGHDPRDSTSLTAPVPDYLTGLNDGVRGMRLGIVREMLDGGIDPGVRARMMEAIENLANQGAEIVEVGLPNNAHAVATYYVIAPAEASSNLARFDGIRYGRRATNASDIIDVYHQSREQGFGPEVKRRIILGTYVLSSGYYDAYYARAQKVRTLIRRDFETAFATCDAILTPVAPAPARRLGEFAGDPLHEYLSDIFTLSANLAGIPGISVPAGTVTPADDPTAKLPVGLQILAPHLAEAKLLQIARAAEAR